MLEVKFFSLNGGAMDDQWMLQQKAAAGLRSATASLRRTWYAIRIDV
jgi:hypothetical protein